MKKRAQMTFKKWRFEYLKWMSEWATPSSFWFQGQTGYEHKIWERKSSYLKKIGLQIEKNVAIDSGFEFVRSTGLHFGEGTSVGKNVRCFNYGDIIVGKFCLIAGEVQICNGSHHIDSLSPYSGSIKIGNGVWIGLGAKIVGTEIEIGNNVIIGAGSLVLNSIGDNEIVAGIPASTIGIRKPTEKVWWQNGYYSLKTYEKIEK